MADDGVGASLHEPSVCGDETERAAQGEERSHTDRQADQLEDQPGGDTPLGMGSDRTEQDTAEGSAEGKEPIAPSPAHRARRTPDQVRSDNPHLLGEEGGTQRAMRLQVDPQGGLREEGGTGGSDEVQRDPDEPVRPRRAVRRQSMPPSPRRRRVDPASRLSDLHDGYQAAHQCPPPRATPRRRVAR